ncbi:MAG: S26 family signal peptidase [Isosphaeraceae bacterium]
MSSGRETVETFVTVFLIFLVFGVEAEGFVIPTGSMAPTLMGRHKEVTCPECGHVYEVNADREVNTDSPTSNPEGLRIVLGTCNNCRFPCRIDDEPNFQGDRIYVIKTPLSFPFVPWLGEARLGRWETAVFKLPEEPEVRYIKRLVGMPGEVVRILRGDIWVGPLDGQAPFHRAMRPLLHQDAMQMLVYDDSKRSAILEKDPRWARWRPAPGGWRESSTGTYDATAPGPAGWSEIRYSHVVPDPIQWLALVEGSPLSHPPRPTLVTDFYAYNTDVSADSLNHPNALMKAWRQPNWVGDLTLRFHVEVREAAGAFRIELVKGGTPYRAEVDLSNGLATLFEGDRVLGQPVQTGLNRVGGHDLAFSNVDDRLSLRVDGALPFGEGVSYSRTPGDGSPGPMPTSADLHPAAVAVRDARVSVGRLILLRDIYYTLRPSVADLDSLGLEDPLPTEPVAFHDWMSDPSRFSSFSKLGPRDFPVAPGRYLMLGDNSPWSRDGRAWERLDQIDPDGIRSGGWDHSGRESWEVPESLLIGKAFCVYWPHLKPFGPTFRLGRDTKLPARPYVEKFRWIR